MTSTLGREEESPYARRNMRTRRTLAALAMIALISASCSNAPVETGIGSIACS
jgi:hypothetical protein